MSENRDQSRSLDQLLTRAAPPRTPITPQVEDALARMTVQAHKQEREPAERRRRKWKVAGLSIATAVMLGGAGMAAAATAEDWAWWLREPDGAYYFTSLSGDPCEYRVGQIESTDPDVAQAVRDAFREDATVNQDAIVADWEARLAEYAQFTADQKALGVEAPARSDETMWIMSVSRVVDTQMRADLAAQGVDAAAIQEAGLAVRGEIRCNGEIVE